MSVAPNVIDRAFQLAGNGACDSIEALRQMLIGEGYDQVGAHLAGPTIWKDLYKIIRARRGSAKETGFPSLADNF